ncbi:hypothetical protein VTL71DRAFT_10294 [Oculimacula yallundae]|uniref:Uncharacterized protein n=1 Tax=Oculimacula yallundae TaxID=86028 RepID=A0ABR4CSY4_9HELO
MQGIGRCPNQGDDKRSLLLHVRASKSTLAVIYTCFVVVVRVGGQSHTPTLDYNTVSYNKMHSSISETSSDSYGSFVFQECSDPLHYIKGSSIDAIYENDARTQCSAKQESAIIPMRFKHPVSSDCPAIVVQRKTYGYPHVAV